MEWTQLKYAESHWDLSASQKNQVAEAVLAQATAPRTFRLPFLKPILAVATLAVCAFALLLAWPKKPVEETVVTLPGASQEAKPDEYVPSEKKEPIVQNAEKPSDKPAEEKEPAETITPDKEEPADPKEPADESVVETPAIHRFWETEKEMPYEEAVAIVKDKLENRPFDPLTDKERMAYYQCISATGYKDYMSYSFPINIKEKKEHGILIEDGIMLEFFTTKEGVGSQFQKESPLALENEDKLKDIFIQEIAEINEKSHVKQFYANFLKTDQDDVNTPAYKNLISLDINIPFGCGRGIKKFNFENFNALEKPMSEETFRQIIRYYLSQEHVVWVECGIEYSYNPYS